MFKNIAFLGLGLIGGSLAKRIKEYFPETTITAIAHSTETIEYALENGIIDYGATNIESAVKEADLIIVATPIDLIVQYATEAAKHASPNALILDVGSTKSVICQKLKKYSKVFIGGHPMAGKEKSGIKEADSAILENTWFVLTPYATTPKNKLKEIQKLLDTIKMKTKILKPEIHDQAVAAISHAPYFVAAGLLGLADTIEAKTLAATGFKSSTRIAESDTQWGIDIAKTNNPAILKQLTRLEKNIKSIKAMLKSKQFAKLKKYLEKQREARLEIYP